MNSTLGTLTIGHNVTIDGAGHTVTISGGGAVRVFAVNSGTLNLNKLTIANGHVADNSGGGIQNSGMLTVANSIFSGNSSGDAGGAIDNTTGGTLTVSNCTFSGNSAYDGGGICNTGHATVSNSTFVGNSATSSGGAIYNSDIGVYDQGMLTVINSTLAGNSANRGGGIYSTVDYGRATLKNTIVANSPKGKNCAGDPGDLTDGGGNLSYPSDGTCFGIHGDPKLGPLQNNGGPTQTMALGAGSAARDAAVDAICAAAPVNNLDQRGVKRPQGAHCDIGALERTGSLKVYLPLIKR